MIVEVCCSTIMGFRRLIQLGAERSYTDEFMNLRRQNVDKLHLETSRLEKRLSRLTSLMANPPAPADSESRGLLWSLSGGAKSQLRTLEQSIIAWEDDASVLQCPFCQQEFTNYSFRRHHCRLCGRVICGDVQTQCSSLVGLNVANGMISLVHSRESLISYRKRLLTNWC
jgi:rabenosyn-5